eukprot:TRINITY_DN4986_c0_g1_i1.p1 TRINITY_DN4986_c0_g1~~TRINITY_DN4986_c0_g1_i1.p1  ORF type:complete len:1047 (-),score=400.60 TRINITY_DN4986_c0_g1_i1:179-2959(-)
MSAEMKKLQEELQACRAESAAELTALREQLDAARKDTATVASAEVAKLQEALQASKAEHDAELAALRQKLDIVQKAGEPATEVESRADADAAEIAKLQAELQACKADTSAELAALCSQFETVQKAEELAREALRRAEDDSAANASAEVAKLQQELQACRAEGAAELEALKEKLGDLQQSGETTRELEGRASAAEELCHAAQAAAAQEQCRAAAAEEQCRAAEERCRAAEAAAAQEQCRAAAAEEQRRADEEQCRAAVSSHETETSAFKAQIAAMQQELADERARRQQEDSAGQGKLQQLQFVLDDRQQQLAKAYDAIQKKDAELKSLLKQLASAPVENPAAVDRTLDNKNEDAPAHQAPTTFDRMFALPGSLGLEFTKLAAPYVVAQVHAEGVASGLGIQPGDELIMVADESVEQDAWDDLVRKITKRPVVAKFRRAPPTAPSGGNSASQGGAAGLISSMSDRIGETILRAAGGAGDREQQQQQQQQQGAEQLQRHEADMERLTVLLRARDEEIAELGARLGQKDEALQVALNAAGSADTSSQEQAASPQNGHGRSAVAEAVRLAQEKEALAQQLRKLETRLEEVQGQATKLGDERQALLQRCEQETRLKDEQQQLAISLQERCQSLMTQFESLSATCQTLSLDSQQKSGLESQVAELIQMNAQWQQAHQNLNAQSEDLRKRALDSHQLQSEVARLRQFEHAVLDMEAQLRHAEQQLELKTQEAASMASVHESNALTIQRLQGELESMHESGESQAGQLEAELMERSRETAALRREKEEQQRKLEECMKQQEARGRDSEDAKTLRMERDDLRQNLEVAKQEQKTLNGVIERCLGKMEKDAQERPHLVDKRMVTQMLAAYLEQRDNPGPQQEIIAKMADLLGFTSAEREQVGLSQRRKTLADMQEPQGLADLSDRFVDFLMEESEAG